MPIVISRNTDAPPVMEPALSPQQREQLWAHIVKNWALEHTEEIRKAMPNVAAKKETTA